MPIIEACKKATFACKTLSPLLFKFHLHGLFCEQARVLSSMARLLPHTSVASQSAF